VFVVAKILPDKNTAALARSTDLHREMWYAVAKTKKSCILGLCSSVLQWQDCLALLPYTMSPCKDLCFQTWPKWQNFSAAGFFAIS